MLQDIDLRRLAEFHGSGRDFVSVYCRGAGGLEALGHRQRQIASMLEEHPDEAEHFAASMELIHKLFEAHPQTVGKDKYVCAFACAVLDFAELYPIGVEVQEQIVVGPSPFIRPLAELQDEHQTFAVIACDNKGTRIYLVTNDQAELEDRVKGGVKNHVRKGGWSQQRYSRRRDNQLQHYARQVIEELREIVESHQLERIVLMGSKETMHEIHDEMPQQLADLVIAKEAFDLHRKEDEMFKEAYEAYFADEQADEQMLWDRIKNAYKGHGLAVTGATDVLEALQHGRADQVIVIRNVAIPGTACRDCDFVVHGTPQNCQSCGSAEVFEIDLINALTRHAELTSAYVEFCDEIDGLAKVGHVAALLRY